MAQIISIILEPFQYDFVLKAILVGCLIAICCACLGIFLVLKKYAMIGDGLAHVSFGTVAIALLLHAAPLLLSIPLVILASFVILKLNEKANLQGDAAISLVSSFSVATGVLIASMAQGFNVDLFSFLFGSILVIQDTEVILSAVLSVIVLSVLFFFYNTLFAITYDEAFAKSLGMKTKVMNYILIMLTALTIVLGIRVVGTMLISSLIVFPTVSALQIAKGFKTTLLLSAIISVTCMILGISFSFILDLPTGATIVFLNAICFFVLFLVKRLRS